VRHGSNVTDLLQSQLDYYRARAQEYDEWFLRQGRYDRGPELNRRWFEEIGQVRDWLSGWGDLGDVLELAAGTGLWTEVLLAQSRSIHCVDAAPEVIEINRARVAEWATPDLRGREHLSMATPPPLSHGVLRLPAFARPR